ncbi:MAG TPA: hypothetical protein VIE44_03065 [Methylomirabilota bacterium]
MRQLIFLMVAAVVCVGCAVSKGIPDGEYINNPYLANSSTMPDPTWTGFSPVPSAYGHPFRPVGLVLNPIGTALDYAIMRPLYMLGSLAPGWFGFTTDDSQTYHSHIGDSMDAKDAPRYRYE